MTNQFYSDLDAAMLARRQHVKDMVFAIKGNVEYVMRGRADPGVGIQELHFDFETEHYSFWVAFRRNGSVYIQRDCKVPYSRQRFFGYSVPHFEAMKSIICPVLPPDMREGV